MIRDAGFCATEVREQPQQNTEAQSSYVSQESVAAAKDLHVKVYIQPSPQIVTDAIGHHVQDDGCGNPLTSHDWKKRLSLATQTHRELRLITAQALAERRVLDKYLQDEQI